MKKKNYASKMGLFILILFFGFVIDTATTGIDLYFLAYLVIAVIIVGAAVIVNDLVKR